MLSFTVNFSEVESKCKAKTAVLKIFYCLGLIDRPFFKIAIFIKCGNEVTSA